MSHPRPASAIAILLLLLATAAGADVTYKQKISGGGMGGRGASTTTSTTVISGDRSRTDDETSFGGAAHHVTRITRLDQGVIWTIVDDRKEYSETSIDELKKLAAGVDSTLDSTAIDVKQTGKKDTVNGYAADEAIASWTGPLPPSMPMDGTMHLTMDVWSSKAVPGGDEMRAFARAFALKAGMDPSSQRMGRVGRMLGHAVERVQGALAQIDGVPVSTTMTIEIKSADADGPGGPGPMSFTTELLSASTDKATVSFDLPKGYKKVESLGMGGMGGGRPDGQRPGGDGR